MFPLFDSSQTSGSINNRMLKQHWTCIFGQIQTSLPVCDVEALWMDSETLPSAQKFCIYSFLFQLTGLDLTKSAHAIQLFIFSLLNVFL